MSPTRVRRVFIFPHSHMPQGAGIVCAHRRTCNLQEQGAPTCLATAAALSRHERVHARPASIGNGTSTGHRSTRPGMVVSFRASELFRGRQTHAGYRPPFEERVLRRVLGKRTAGPNVGHGAAQASPMRLLQASRRRQNAIVATWSRPRPTSRCGPDRRGGGGVLR